jgi:3-hydroxybutyryl-CoA dehydrogenase
LRAMCEEEKEEIMERIHFTTDFMDLTKADLIIESVVENPDVKKGIFKELGGVLHDKTIVASNTSSLSIDDLASAYPHPEYFVGLHFFNPITKMRLIEVIKGKKTSQETILSILGLSYEMNKTPILTKDTPCFIVNRLLGPYLNEAAYEAYEGVASVEDIDNACLLGLNQPIGPLALSDLIGLDIVLEILNNLYMRTKNPRYVPCPLLVDMVSKGLLGKKTGEGFYKYPKR